MKSASVKVLMVFVILTALSAAQTVIAGEPLPLKHGLYVPEDCPCESINNAMDLRYYSGKGLGMGSGTKCTIINVRNNGNVYYITQKVIYEDKLEGTPAKTINETITIKNITAFSTPNDANEQKRTKKKETVYRLCPKGFDFLTK